MCAALAWVLRHHSPEIDSYIEHELLQSCEETIPSKLGAEALVLFGKHLTEMAHAAARNAENMLQPIPDGEALHIAEAEKVAHLAGSGAQQAVVICSKCAADGGVANIAYKTLLEALGDAVSATTGVPTVVLDFCSRVCGCIRKVDKDGDPTNSCSDLEGAEFVVQDALLRWIVLLVEMAGVAVHRVVTIHKQLPVAHLEFLLPHLAGRIDEGPHYRNLSDQTAFEMLFMAVGGSADDPGVRARWRKSFSELQRSRCEYSFSQQPPKGRRLPLHPWNTHPNPPAAEAYFLVGIACLGTGSGLGSGVDPGLGLG